MNTIIVPREGLPPLLFPERIQCGPTHVRHRITVAQWANRPDDLIDSSAYAYNSDAAEMGTECWRVIDGVDPWASAIPGDLFDLWFDNSYAPRTVGGGESIYVSERHYAALASIIEFDSWAVRPVGAYMPLDRDRLRAEMIEQLNAWAKEFG